MNCPGLRFPPARSSRAGCVAMPSNVVLPMTMPVETQFRGAVYGSLFDRFGINRGFHFDLE